MTATIPSANSVTGTNGPSSPVRVTTIISGAGVLPMVPAERSSVRPTANENYWFDRIGFRRRWYANLAAIGVTLSLLWAGVWIVQEFVRLQKLEACYEAGRRNCAPLNMDRRGK